MPLTLKHQIPFFESGGISYRTEEEYMMLKIQMMYYMLGEVMLIKVESVDQ